MTFKELYDNLSMRYPNALKCEWDNDGIMCASNLNSKVKNVLIVLDVTMDTINYAIENGFDTIISHHPLVFRSQKSLMPLNYTQNKLIKLIKNDINVMSFHTRLDASNPGVNDVLANLLELENVIEDSMDKIGRLGTYSFEMTLCDFALKVKNALGCPFVLYNGNKTVKKVYVVGGDGKDLIENAIQCGADTIITGRASYNTTIDAKDMEINIVEAGHFYTENPVCKQIEKDVLCICPTIKTEIYYSNLIECI